MPNDTSNMETPSSNPPKKSYTWPRYLLAAVILGIVLSVLAVIKEAKRVQSMERIPVYPGAASQSSPQ